MLREKSLAYVSSREWKKRRTSAHILMEIMLQFAYPRYSLFFVFIFHILESSSRGVL
jgi:hypothetical protein